MAHIHANNFEPASFLVENIDLLPRGRALDIAMGSGRNAIYLAKMGFDIEGVDKSPEAVAQAREMAQSAGVSMKAEIADLEADYHIEREKLSQVFLNIILNAIDAVPEGGKIRVRMEKKAGSLAVLVSDNGPGIATELKERVFLPFYTEKEDGTGLGLPISRKIVESYGGRITVSDANDGGACFTIFLPQSARDSSFKSVRPVSKSIDEDTLCQS